MATSVCTCTEQHTYSLTQTATTHKPAQPPANKDQQDPKVKPEQTDKTAQPDHKDHKDQPDQSTELATNKSRYLPGTTIPVEQA